MSLTDAADLLRLNAAAHVHVLNSGVGAPNWKRQRLESNQVPITVVATHRTTLKHNNKPAALAKTESQKKAERKERNRLSAERHRRKQREYTEQLE